MLIWILKFVLEINDPGFYKMNPHGHGRGTFYDPCRFASQSETAGVHPPKLNAKAIQRRRMNNKRGSSMIAAYLVIVVLITLGAGFIVVSLNESKTAERQKRTAMAFHIAEAGIERAIYDLRQDFLNDASSPSWSDADINGFVIGPNTSSFYSIPYSPNSLNGGTYSVVLKNVAGTGESIWIRSTGSLGDATQTIQVFARMFDVSPWNNAIFAGGGASGTMINGNVNIQGSVHILGTNLQPTDLAVNLGGTAELIGNNYADLDPALAAKVPNLPTTVLNGETVQTLNAELRVKRGIVSLSGSATVGEPDATGNTVKETVDGVYVTDGFGGSQGTTNVYSDNGASNSYDLGNLVSFPRLSDPYGGYATYQAYLKDNALVISDAVKLNELANITPGSSFSYSNANGSISIDGNGNMTISGIVYVGDDVTPANLNMRSVGGNKTINYTGSGALLVTGNAQIDVSLVTSGNNSFPDNIIGIMTPNTIGFNVSQIDVMGLFYGEDTVNVQKQTDIMGTIVSNYFDMGTNVPSIFQVPETVNNIPEGMIAQEPIWVMRIVSWQRL